jgi:hypothetical protein
MDKKFFTFIVQTDAEALLTSSLVDTGAYP